MGSFTGIDSRRMLAIFLIFFSIGIGGFMQNSKENQRFCQRIYGVILTGIEQYHGVRADLVFLAVAAGKLALPLQNDDIYR